MAKNINQQLTPKELEKILAKQTDVILSAVSEKLINTEKSLKKETSEKLTNVEESIRIDMSEKLINTEESLKKEILKTEERINQKIDELITTLDSFLKRMSIMEDEFEMMKADINRMKRIIKEKLGVEIL